MSALVDRIEEVQMLLRDVLLLAIDAGLDNAIEPFVADAGKAMSGALNAAENARGTE